MLNKYFTSLEGLLDQINSFQTQPEPTGKALFFEEPFQVYGLILPKIGFRLPTDVYLVSYAVAQLLDKDTICYWAYGNPLKKEGGKLYEIHQKNIIRIIFHKGIHAAVAFHNVGDPTHKPFFTHLFDDSGLTELPTEYISVYLNSIQEQFRVNTEYEDLFRQRLEKINRNIPNFV